ncbi:TatD DNase [Haplosporangium gracile]|nr:TatD DNase [Haplosporangium gracile]
MPPRLIDIGINLTDPMFRGLYNGKQAHVDDLAQVLFRSKRAGVDRMIVTGGNLSDCKEALDLVKNHDGLFMTVGCHPTRCSEFESHADGPEGYFNALKAYLDNPETKGKVVAIGECGLDYDRLHFCPKETQQKYFERQFDLAESTCLPMFLHNRNTGEDFGKLVTQHRSRFTHGVVHSFTGSVEEMQQYLDLGLYIGINGCSLKTEENLKVAVSVPLDRLMLETDGPWCDIRPTHASFKHLSKMTPEQQAMYSPPSKKKEKFESGLMVKNRNEPCTMGQVLHVMADLHGMDPDTLADIVYRNTTKVFFPDRSVHPTKLAQRMKKDDGSSTTNGDPKKRKGPFNTLWGSTDFDGYGVNGVGDHSDEQDEGKDSGNIDPAPTPRKRKSREANGGTKIGGVEVKTRQLQEDTPSKKQKSGTAPPNPPVNSAFVNFFNKVQVNDIKKPKESASPSSMPASSPHSASPQTVSASQPAKSLKEMFDRSTSSLRPQETPTDIDPQEGAEKANIESIDLTCQASSSSGKFKPLDSEPAPREARKKNDSVTKTSTSMNEPSVAEPVSEMMDVDDDEPAQSTPVKSKKFSTKSRSKATKSKKVATNDELEENPRTAPAKGSGTKKRKPVTTDKQGSETKFEDAAEAPKEDPPKEDPPKNRSVLEFFKFQPKSEVKVAGTPQDKAAAGTTISGEAELATTKITTKGDQDQDQTPMYSRPRSHSSKPVTPSFSASVKSTITTPADESLKEDTKEVVLEEPAALVDEASSLSGSEKPSQPRRRRLVRASHLQRTYNESSGSDEEQEGLVQTARKRRVPNERKQDDGTGRDTDPLPESEPEPETEPEQELAHVAASRQLFKSYFGSTSSLPLTPKVPKELVSEANNETKCFDLGVARPAQKTYSKKPAPVLKKKAQRKRSAFSGSDEPGSDRDSRSDDDLSDFEIKVDEKPDPNQKSISSMFAKAPPRPTWALPVVKPERRKELTSQSQSLLSGGLVNVGNTCYLNSVLQALRNTPGCTDTLYLMMRRILKSAELTGRDLKSGTYKWRIFEQVITTFHDLDNREGRSAADQIYERSLCPKQIIETLRGGKSQFNTSGQQDVPEFLLYLISHFDDIQKAAQRMGAKAEVMLKVNVGIETETEIETKTATSTLPATSIVTSRSSSASSSSSNSSLFSYSTTSSTTTTTITSAANWEPVNDLFQISTERVQVCAKCNKVTIKNDRDFDLTVQIDTANPGLIRDLEWGISDTMKQEVTTEDNKRYCERCKTNEHAHISNFFTSLPKIMILRLQRSNFMQGAVKIPNGVACSQRMNFREWMSSTYQGDHPDYELCAIIVHRGREMFAGHYFAYIRKDTEIETAITEPDGESWIEKKSYSWLKYNDSSVDPVSDEDMEKLFSGNVKKTTISDSNSPGENNKAHISGEDKIDLSALTSILDSHVATPYVYLYRRLDN